MLKSPERSPDSEDMADESICPKVQRCPMFPEFQSQRALRVLQIIYCENTYTECARYQSISKGVVPPTTLLPDGKDLTTLLD